jgi:type II secretory pathway pseudopilin PulG
MMRPERHRPAFAMVTAIVLMGLIALTLAALGTAFVIQSRRTLALAEDAQLRQLLLAGALEAQSRLAASALDKNIPIALPDELRDRGASLSLQPEPSPPASQTVIRIEAALPHHRMAQRLTLAQTDGRWQVIAAELLP